VSLPKDPKIVIEKIAGRFSFRDNTMSEIHVGKEKNMISVSFSIKKEKL
jgi:hypothetical protein